MAKEYALEISIGQHGVEAPAQRTSQSWLLYFENQCQIEAERQISISFRHGTKSRKLIGAAH
jgi:hypothetical protein